MVEHFPESLSSEEKATATNTYAGLEESVNINSLSLSLPPCLAQRVLEVPGHYSVLSDSVRWVAG